jgi:hypothetical protein
MNIRRYFDYNPELELTVAQIGINKWDWVDIDGERIQEAKEKMQSNRFDILPIVENGVCSSYFKTKEWGNFNTIEVHHISDDDKLYYRLSFIDLLRNMLKNQKQFYFLTDTQENLGLISINNLNCLAVYNFLFQITASIERIVSDFLKEILNEDEVIEILKNTSDNQANSVVENYLKLKSKNSENTIFEHLYLQTLGTILKNVAHKIPKDKKDILTYRKKFCADNLYWDIRNKVAHPVRPLFTDKKSIENVNELISDYLKIKEILG